MSEEEEQIHDDAEAYALGSLDAAAKATFAAHLRVCERCREAVREYEVALAALPAALASATAVRPDPALRQRVLRAALRPSRSLPLLGSVVAAALLVALALGAWSVQLSDTLAREREARAQERELFTRLAGQQEIVFEVIDSPRSSKLFLRSPVSNSAAYGKVFTRSDLPFVVAMAGRLADPPAGEAYYLWLTYDSGETVLAGLLSVDRTGFGSLVYEAGRVGPTFQSARVTLQARGADSPQGVPVLFWSR